MSEQVTAVSAVLEDGGQVNIRQANAGRFPTSWWWQSPRPQSSA